MLSIQNLHISVEDLPLVKGVDLTIQSGEIQVLMGQNGSGKSTLVNTIAGHPSYTIQQGSITIDGQDMTNASPDERAKAGLFLSLQHIPNVPGVTIGNFLRLAYSVRTGEKVNPLKFHKKLVQECDALGIDPNVLKRALGVGFSGGEKKQLEMLQIAVLQPRVLLFDEIDSGLDIDALKKVLARIEAYAKDGAAILIITHYPTILTHLSPDTVSVMRDGVIAHQGKAELIAQIEQGGFEQLA